MPAATKKLVLVDGSSYLHRAYHALPALSGPSGQPTGAVYGVVNMLRALLKQEQPDRFAVVFDPRGKTFRHEIYPDYKANRPPTPEDLKAQVPLLFQVVRAHGYPLLQVTGFEADDVIGTLAQLGVERGCTVLISTGDKDLAQLIMEDVTLVDTLKNERIDADKIRDKFGVAPAQIVDFLAIAGDTSDNIPGVSGVGPKTAAKWLCEYGSLEGVLANAGKIKGKVGEKLKAAQEQLPLYRELTTIRRDVKLDTQLEDLVIGGAHHEMLRALCKEHGFSRWLEELPDAADAPGGGVAERHYRLILEESSLDEWIEKLSAAEYFALDTETTSLDYMQAKIVGLSFTTKEGEAVYIPLAHDYEQAPRQLPLDATLERLRPLLENPGLAKIGHNLKYDREVLANHGIRLEGIRHDSMLESYVYDSVASRHDLDSLSAKYLGIQPVSYEQVAGKGAKQKPFSRVALKTAGDYAAEDADLCLRLHHCLHPQLAQNPGLLRVYEQIEMPLLPVLADIERRGVLIDPKLLQAQSSALQKDLEKVSREAYALAGREFNMDSPKQIQEILFDEAGLPVTRKTPGGKPSTAEDVLQELALSYDLPRLVLQHRTLSKLKSTYTDKLPQMINPESGRIHTSYHQAVTATGRLSSANPNLQNIPVRTAQGRRIRRAFIASPGRKLIAADYSQIEMRIMAHLSRDENLLQAFRRDEDIHAATAAEVFSVPAEAVSAEQRRIAKAINFGLIYGMSAFGLARQLGLSRGVAQEYVDMYFARYPGVRRYMDETRHRAREQGYVETLFGRRLWLPEIKARNAQRRQYVERTAINAPMQGSAADIIKRAMIALHQWLNGGDADAAIIMQVHDELVIEVAEEQVQQVMEECCARMSAAAKLSIPMTVGARAGDNWDEAH